MCGPLFVLKMIHSLPSGYKAVFNLYAIEGYDHKEIAELLGISEGTSKSQLCRARVKLIQMIRTDLQKKSEVIKIKPVKLPSKAVHYEQIR